MVATQDGREGLLDVLEAEVDPLLTACIKADVDGAHDAATAAAHVGDNVIAFDDGDTASISSLQTQDQDDKTSVRDSVASTDPLKWYPHWEKNLLNDKVMLQPKEELTTLEKLKLASRLSLATSASSASTDTLASEEYHTAASSASSTTGWDEAQSTYTSPFVHSFALPNIPLATHFPPFASKAQLLKSGPSTSLPSLNRSFASAMPMATHPSAMHRFPGVDNQIQGPFQEKHIWHPLSRPNSSDSLHFKSSLLDFAVKEDLAVDNLDALHGCVHARTRTNSSANSTTVGLEDEELRQLIQQQWPIVGTIPKGRTEELISGTSSLIDTDSACTCGHQQSALRAPPSTAVEYLEGHGAADRVLQTPGPKSQSSTRAIASIQEPYESDISSIADSRTSSDMYLSPNNPERESHSGESEEYSHRDSFVTASTATRSSGAVSDVSTDTGISSRVSDSSSSFSGSSRDGHRAYYPRDRFARSKTQPRTMIGGFLRRMSGIGRQNKHATSGPDYFQRMSSGDSPTSAGPSSPSFFDWPPSNGRPRAPSPPSPSNKRGFGRRGRSYTVRRLDDTIPDTSDMLTPRPLQPQTNGLDDAITGFPVPPSRQADEGPSSAARRRFTAGPGFVRRLSAQLRFPSLNGANGRSNKTAPLTAVSDASASATPSSSSPSGPNGNGLGSSAGEGNEPGILFRNFRLGGPKAPMGFGRR